MQARRCISAITRSGAGRAFYDHACALKVEGIVSKRIDAP
jgi:ATP-dependent DNA ligase